MSCGIVYHYPIYGDRALIGRSNLLYACTNRSLLREPLEYYLTILSKNYTSDSIKTLFSHYYNIKQTADLIQSKIYFHIIVTLSVYQRDN